VTLRRLLASSALGLTARAAPLAIRLRRHRRGNDIVHVIGDSHVALFSGTDAMVDAWPRRSRDVHERFRTYRLGSVLAYRLPDWGTTSQGRERLLTALAFGRVPRGGTVLLSFGEIDCRYHLPKHVEESGREMEDVVRECARRYAGVVREVRDLGYSTFVWAVVPSREQAAGGENPEYPHWGSTRERNEITRAFNTAVAEELALDDIAVVSVFDEVMGAGGLEPDGRYYLDAVHLSSEALPLAVDALDRALGRRSHASHTKS